MDQTLTQLGRIEIQKVVGLEPFDQYIQNPFPKKQKCAVVLIQFTDHGDHITYDGLATTGLSANNFREFAYRKGSSRGGDITFTTKFSSGVEKKINTILTNQFPKTIELAEKVDVNEVQLFKRWKRAFEENINQIRNNLEDKLDQLEKDLKTTTIMTFKLKTQRGDVRLRDLKTIQHQLCVNGTEGKYNKYSVVSKGKDKVCSICHEKKALVLGFGSPFKYSTVDKPGMVSGYFQQKNNWKNYPICEQCSLELEFGKKYLDQFLRFSFYGMNLYIIPQTVLADDDKTMNQALSSLRDIREEILTTDAPDLMRNEDRLMRKLGQLSNLVTLSLLFFEENMTNKSIKLKLHIEELPPSRFRTLFSEIPSQIESDWIFHKSIRFKKAKQWQDMKFNFGVLHTFFEDDFLEAVARLMYQKPFNRRSLLNRFSHTFQANYAHQISGRGYELGKTITTKSIMLHKYLEKLKLLN